MGIYLGSEVPLTVDLGRGMAILSNAAMAIAGGLMIYILLFGPTHFIMGGVVQATGQYFDNVLSPDVETVHKLPVIDRFARAA